jgi:hypothetical protein
MLNKLRQLRHPKDTICDWFHNHVNNNQSTLDVPVNMCVFEMLTTLDSLTFKSTYVKGLTYSVRQNNHLLLRVAEDWVHQGFAKWIAAPVAQTMACLNGKGKVR